VEKVGVSAVGAVKLLNITFKRTAKICALFDIGMHDRLYLHVRFPAEPLQPHFSSVFAEKCEHAINPLFSMLSAQITEYRNQKFV
jgi:hypothetical protein